MADSAGGAGPGICAVTGTSGYVGSHVAGLLAETGWEVRAFTRSGLRDGQDSFTEVYFELEDSLKSGVFDGVDALVHTAYDLGLTRWRDIERINVEGSRRLFAAARDAGVQRVVCISTLAAFPGSRSRYGRAKLEIERAAMEAGGTVIRPGLVWGPDGAAMFGALQHVVDRLRLVPLLVPVGLELSMVHEDDLGLLVARLLDRWPQSSGKLLVAASAQTLTFVELLRSLALRAGKRVRFVRLPWRLGWLGLRVLESIGVTPPFRSDSLVSFVAIDHDPFAHATDHAERYDVHFRPYSRL